MNGRKLLTQMHVQEDVISEFLGVFQGATLTKKSTTEPYKTAPPSVSCNTSN